MMYPPLRQEVLKRVRNGEAGRLMKGRQSSSQNPENIMTSSVLIQQHQIAALEDIAEYCRKKLLCL